MARSPASFTGGFVAISVSVALTAAAWIVGESTAAAERTATPEVSRMLEQGAALAALLAGLGAFLTVFLVASANAVAVAKRRRELALLRLVGASRRRITRLVLLRAGSTSAAASLAGIALAVPAAFGRHERTGSPRCAARSRAPRDLRRRRRPGNDRNARHRRSRHAGGQRGPTRRAGRIAPIEALREAAVDLGAMTRSRWIRGLGSVGAALAMLALVPRAPTEGRIPLGILFIVPLVVGLAFLAPWLVPPIAGLLARLSRPVAGTAGRLAAANVRARVRSTASTATPILLTVGMTVSLMGGSALLGAADRENAERLYISAVVVLARQDGDLRASLLALPGVQAAVDVYPTTVKVLANRAVREHQALGVSGSDPSSVLGLGHVFGDLSHLTGDSIAIARSQADATGVGLGDSMNVQLADRVNLRVRVVATFDGPPLDAPLLLPASLVRERSVTGATGTTQVHVALQKGVDPGPVLEEISRQVPDDRAVLTSAWLKTISHVRTKGMAFGARILTGFALAYTLVAIAGTIVMSFSGRRSEFRLLRSLGASPGQVQAMVLWESLAIALVGIAAGAIAGAVGLAGLWSVLHAIHLDVPPEFPLAQLVVIALVCCLEVTMVAAAATAGGLRQVLSSPTSGEDECAIT